MKEAKKVALIADWIQGQAGGAGSKAEKQNRWAIDAMTHLAWKDPELAWELILRIHKTIEEEIRSILAAGPLEDLMKQHGKAFISRIEKMARKDSRFRDLMHGVWLSRDVPEWKRFYKAAGRSQPKHLRKKYRSKNGG